MKKSFLHGTLILMTAASLNRVIGFVYQAVIYRLIGPEGVGLFNLVYPVYILIMVIATAGIPLGISKLVSEEEARGNSRGSYQVLWVALSVLTISGVFFTLLAYAISPLLLQHIFVNKMVYPVFLSLLPGIFIISISSAFRGFFQGLLNMKPPALGQVVEQVVRVLTGISLAVYFLPRGIQWAAAGIAAAGVAGEIAGFLTMLPYFFRGRPVNMRFALPRVSTVYHILRKIFEMCAPITMGRIVATIMLSVDSVLIPLMLKEAGHSTSAATAIFGQLTGVAMTLLFVPSVVTVSLATSLVPAISEAVAMNQDRLISSRTAESIKLTLLAGIPFITAYLVLPSQITGAIYGAPQSGQLLAILAAGGIFAYLQQTTTGILQGLGFPVVPLKNMIIGGTLKIPLIFILTSSMGIYGTALSYDIFFVVAAFLNLYSLSRYTGYRLSLWSDLGKPVFAGLLTTVVYSRVYDFVLSLNAGNSISTVISVTTGFVFYAVVLIYIGIIEKRDLKRIPFIKRFL